MTQAPGYRQEDKWTFLTEGKALGVPVSPFIDDVPAVVLKHKSIEVTTTDPLPLASPFASHPKLSILTKKGGMGIFFYKNAAAGGDWIIQEQLTNASWLRDLLPPNSPLSTMRVITTSTWSLCHHTGVDRRTGAVAVNPTVRRLLLSLPAPISSPCTPSLFLTPLRHLLLLLLRRPPTPTSSPCPR